MRLQIIKLNWIWTTTLMRSVLHFSDSTRRKFADCSTCLRYLKHLRQGPEQRCRDCKPSFLCYVAWPIPIVTPILRQCSGEKYLNWSWYLTPSLITCLLDTDTFCWFLTSHGYPLITWGVLPTRCMTNTRPLKQYKNKIKWLKMLNQFSGGAYRHSGSFSIVISYRIFAIIW